MADSVSLQDRDETGSGRSRCSSPVEGNNRSRLTRRWSTQPQTLTKAQSLLEQTIISQNNVEVSQLSNALEKSWLTKAIGIVICLNTIQLAMAVDHNGPQWSTIWYIADHAFTIIFALEMIIKIAILKKSYFYLRWNVVDFVVVLVSIASLWIMDAGDAGPLSAVRSLRLMRLVRSIRFLSEKREIVMLVEGIGASLGAMFWIGLLLAMIILICAILCTELIGHTDYPELKCNAPDNKELFGNLPRSILTLLNVALMAEWGEVSRLLLDHQIYLVPPFLFFVFVTTLGVLNVIVGVIVDRTNEASNRLRSRAKKKIQMQQLESVLHLSQLLQERNRLDSDYSIDMSSMQTIAAEKDEQVAKCIESIDLPYGFVLEDLRVMMDMDGDGDVTEQELIEGLTRLITNSEFHNLCQAQRSRCQIKQLIQRFRRETSQALGRIEDSIALLRADFQERGHHHAVPDAASAARPPTNQLDRALSAQTLAESSKVERDLIHATRSWEVLPAERQQVARSQADLKPTACPTHKSKKEQSRDETTANGQCQDKRGTVSDDEATERFPRKLQAESIHLAAPTERQASRQGDQRHGLPQVVRDCRRVQNLRRGSAQMTAKSHAASFGGEGPRR